MYTNLNQVLAQAEALNMTIGAFNTHNLEMLPDMIRAAEAMGSPIIIQTSVDTAKYIGYEVLVAVTQSLAKRHAVDVVLHLDHAKQLEDIRAAIEAGYTSIMFDGSSLPFKENIAKTKAIVDYAHPLGVSVEGELGTIGGTEEGVSTGDAEIAYTRPEDARHFVELTGVDALAVAIGTHHGQFKSKTQVNLDLLADIHANVRIPLVLHGGTGVKEEDYPALINRGIRKFNVGTELLVNWTSEAQQQFAHSSVNRSLRHNIIPANQRVKEIIQHKIALFMNIHGGTEEKWA